MRRFVSQYIGSDPGGRAAAVKISDQVDGRTGKTGKTYIESISRAA